MIPDAAAMAPDAQDRRVDRPGRRLPLVVGGAAAAGAAAWVAVRDPTATWVLPPCPFHAITGGWCPLCGLTRGTHALLHGDLVGAMSFNVLTPVAIGVAIWTVLAAARSSLQLPAWWPRPLQLGIGSQRWLLAGLATFTVARNLPFAWSRSLAP